MREFLAVDIDPKHLNKIAEIQRGLSDADAPVKFVERENLHLTLKFFGEISDTKNKEIISIVQEKLKKYQPFPLHIKRMGVFPNLGYIRVVWLGIEEPNNFSVIQKDLDHDFINMGFKKERSYTPHLTIGRVKGAHNKEALVAKIKELEEVDIGKMTIDRVVLKKSELTPAGPIYTNQKEFQL
jgi:RNA 2',3'-cyclic 3'-phosphodiesterase